MSRRVRFSGDTVGGGNRKVKKELSNASTSTAAAAAAAEGAGNNEPDENCSSVLDDGTPDGTIHWLSMSFRDKSLETELRRRSWSDAYLLHQLAIVLMGAHHIAAVAHDSSLTPISLIWAPLCVFQLLSRHTIHVHLADQARAHELGSRILTLLIVVGTSLQRLALAVPGLHPQVAKDTALARSGEFALLFIMLHLSHVGLAYRLVLHACVTLSLATSGWGGDSRGWTQLGQPFDTLYVVVANVVGAAIGHCAEVILRRAFFARHVERRRADVVIERLEREKQRAQCDTA